MKKRIITGVVGIALLTVVFFLRDTFFFTIAIGLLSLMGVNELLHAIKLRSRAMLYISLIYAALLPYICSTTSEPYFKITTILYGAAMLICMVIETGRTSFLQLAATFTSTIFVAFSFATLIFLRDIYRECPDVYSKENGLFFILLVLVAAWGSDTGAYFTGVFFGKHKLAPTISPKKTVEGLIGGFVSCIVLTAVLIAIFNSINKDISLDYLLFLPISGVLSIVGVFGDLSTSVIKRSCGIKDFGKILPGHGGIMDRFDSVLLISPVLYALLLLFSRIFI